MRDANAVWNLSVELMKNVHDAKSADARHLVNARYKDGHSSWVAAAHFMERLCEAPEGSIPVSDMRMICM